MGNPKIGKRDAGAGLSAGHADANRSSYEDILKAIRDELTAVKGGATITQADATVASGSYVEAQVQSIVDLANDLKTKLNAIAGLLNTFDK